MKNPKSEIRNPNEAPRAKSQKVGQAARSVLDCGSPLLLCRRTGKDEGRVTRPPEFPARPGESARGLAHSKTWRLIGARNLFRFNSQAPREARRCPSSLLSETRSGLKSALLGVVATLLLGATCTHAQSYFLDWFTIDSGGGTSAGGNYTLSGTIGQPDAGTLSGGDYTLEGGFWPGIVVPSTTGLAPTLFIQLSGNSVIVSWPSPSTGFVLRQSVSLGIPVWSEVVQAPGDNGTIKGVTLTLSPGGTFYRLMKP